MSKMGFRLEDNVKILLILFIFQWNLLEFDQFLIEIDLYLIKIRLEDQNQ